MSRLQGKPHAQKVVESLDATERANLLGLLNGSSVVPAFRSLTNATAYITDADEGVSHVSLETADGNLTGYLAYTDSYVTLFAYERNSQGIAQYEIDLDAMTIKVIDETLDIEGLRTIVTDSLKADLVGGKVPAEQLPSYVDDVVEYEDLAHFPAEGEYGKIYIALDTGSTYRWGGTEYVQIGGSSATPMISITWSELKTLRDGGNLLPGQQYRITDYACTALGDGITVGGNVFDIIVTAEDESHLEEEAFATHHAGDTYFASNKLEAWRIWYALDNDTTRFEWADATNGKGVIYRMIDEFGNDVPYDFKNIKVDNYYTFSKKTDGNWVDASKGDDKVFDNVIREQIASSKHRLNRIYFYISIGNLQVYENSFDVDCHQNTFSGGANKNQFGKECYNNKFSSGAIGNTLGAGCYSNTFGASCTYNELGEQCYGNTFGPTVTYTHLDSLCYNNEFKDSSNGNILGEGCNGNVFRNNAYSNTLGIACRYNDFSNVVNNNNIGSTSSYITIGSYSSYNDFGPGCNNIDLRGHCDKNTFGPGCHHIYFGTSYSPMTYCQHMIFDGGVGYIDLSCSVSSTTYYVQNIHVHSGIAGVSGTPVSIVVPERGQAYSYDYYATNSVDVMI